MKAYHDLLHEVLTNGIDRKGRNGGTRALFGKQMRFDLHEGFPAITTKKLAFRTMAIELLWFMQGYTDNNELTRLKCNIWTANAEAPYWTDKAAFLGDLGRVYGAQWRTWQAPDGETIDQLAQAIEQIQSNPDSRRIIVNAWNPGEIDQMALPPCHAMFQFFVHNGELSLHLYQRSADLFLGVPFNIASYALLLSLVAHMTNLRAAEVILTLGDAHIYHNHFDAVKEQLSRQEYPLPSLWINPDISKIEDLDTKKLAKADDVYNLFKLENYQSHPTIKATMAV